MTAMLLHRQLRAECHGPTTFGPNSSRRRWASSSVRPSGPVARFAHASVANPDSHTRGFRAILRERVAGNLASPILVMHEGAILEGHCTTQREVAREDRKVTVFPKEERLAQAGGHKQS